MADRSLSFNVAAIDRASKSFEKIAGRIEKLEGKLDKLDRKDVDVEVNVDTDTGLSRIRRFGRKINRITSGISQGFVTAGTDGVKAFGTALSALPPQVQALIFASLLPVLVAAMATVGAIASSAFVLAFGAGLAAIGIVAAAQSKKVRKAFDDLADHVKKVAKDIAAPFEPALRGIAKIAKDAFDSFVPVLKQSFQLLAPAVKGFAADLADAFKGLAPSLEPLSNAFSDLLSAIGPRLKPLFASIGDELTRLARVVSKHKELFATVFVGLLHAIPLAIRLLTFLARQFVRVANGARVLASFALTAFVAIAKGVRFVVDQVLAFYGALVHGAAKAFGWIPGLGGKLRSAAKGFDRFRAGVNTEFNKMIGKARGFRRSLDRIPKIIRLKGNIHDLQQKIRTAKNKLKQPGLTKPEKSKIRANIHDLRQKVNAAKRKLRQLHDKTVTVTVYQRFGGVSGPGFAHPHRAAGGPVAAGRTYLVGERGPELFTPTANGQITSNDKLDRAVSDSGDVFVTVELDGAPIAARIRAHQREDDRFKRRRVLAGSGRRAA